MNEEALAVRPAGRWAPLWTRSERLLEKYPGVLLGISMGLVLLGYAVPLVFPVATVVLSYRAVDALIERRTGGPRRTSDHVRVDCAVRERECVVVALAGGRTRW